MLTLNQIIGRIKALALAHEQINSFAFGRYPDKDRGEIQYPLCFMTLPTEQASLPVNAGTQDVLRFSLYFEDREIQGGSEALETFNSDEVLSDMREVAKDIFAQMRHPSFYSDWKIEPDISLTYGIEGTADWIAGVRMDIAIKMPFGNNYCEVPSTYIY